MYKLLVVIINYGMARKVVKAVRKAGAQGGTTIMGKGTGGHKIKKVLGITVEPEKEIIFILVKEGRLGDILMAAVKSGKINNAGQGIAFVLDVERAAGICHEDTDLEKTKDLGRMGMGKENKVLYNLIITIVNKGDSDKVVEAARRAGAEGGTVVFGRGTGIHEHAKLFGIIIEPEKDIVLTIIDRERTDEVMSAIVLTAGLDRPGKGISFVVGVDNVVGIDPSLNKAIREKFPNKH
ncbi:MAG: P-II family nitrogen regulator [Clostridia bacterium]|nr:P-II family nitrogen regulator [Clostridia bacterium]